MIRSIFSFTRSFSFVLEVNIPAEEDVSADLALSVALVTLEGGTLGVLGLGDLGGRCGGSCSRDRRDKHMLLPPFMDVTANNMLVDSVCASVIRLN